MCAYKLCKVEFRYWGMQTKIEKFIHEVGKFIIFLVYVSILPIYWMLCDKHIWGVFVLLSKYYL